MEKLSADMLTGLSPKVSAEAKAPLHSLYGLDKPLHVRYWLWLRRIVRFDFGESELAHICGNSLKWPPYCYNMFTYLKEPDVPRSGNSENSTKVVRSWEKVRYGFRTIKGLQDHLKLYQRAKYLRRF